MANLHLNAAPLPVDFRGTPQDLFDAILDRLEIVSDGVNIVISDTMPSGNQGPWLKEGRQWWVWDEGTSTYIPLDVSASVNRQIAVSDSSTPPDGSVYSFWAVVDGTNFKEIKYYAGTLAGWVSIPPELVANAITSAMIQDGAILERNIAPGAVTAGKIQNDLPLNKLVRGGANQFLRMDSSAGHLDYRSFWNAISSNQDLTAVPQKITWPHGLSTQPNLVRAVLVNITAEQGYTPGMEVELAPNHAGIDGDHLPSIATDNDNVYVFWANEPRTIKKFNTPFASYTITDANWKLKVYAHSS